MVSQPETAQTPARGSANGTIRSVDKVIDILELLGRESRGLPISELAGRLRLNVSTAHHLLATLKARGLVAQDERTKAYRIGSGLVALVSRFLLGTDLYPAAVAAVEQLRNVTGETSYLSVFQDGEINVMVALTGLRPVQARRMHRPGQSNLHSTASGKLLLAYQPPEQAAALLAEVDRPQFTPHTITDLDELLRELAVIRSQGYALDREEDYIGVQCVAAPVFDGNGDCVASVSVSYPAASAERTEELIRLVRDAAEKISVNLGAIPVRSTA
ncbi:MAG: Transcriptional regulator IclR [Thermomicrobiales bacterium]|jgi:IclR family acetate operon transcriptional repressor|nr:Transcriptional regulator IclR [Thermomicrobiales bacterium]MDF3043479.1 Transcriptional regulator IclR [Thermomicrobiales bacterium]